METFRIAEHRGFQVEGHEFLFLTGENALFEVDSPFREDLDRWAQRGAFGKEEFLASVEGSRPEQETVFAGLLKRHILLPMEKTSGGPVGLRTSVPLLPVRTLVLSLTDACNLSCEYCYHAERRASQANAAWMGEEVARKAVDFLINLSGPVRELTLVFFGGEPLLHFELLTSTVRYAREQAQRAGKEISFALTTNGTVSSPEITRFLKEERFSVTVSIDGPGGFDNRHRCFADGAPAHGTVLANLPELVRGDRAIPAVARVTLTNRPEGLTRIMQGLLAAGFCEVGFGPVTTKDPALQIDAEGLDVLLAEFRVLCDRALDAAARGEWYGFSNLIDLLVALHEGDVKNYPCGAGLGLFSVDQSGGLYLCQRFTGEEAFRVGDVVNGFDSAKLTSFRERAEITQRGTCQECWVRNLCAGGCYHEAWVREGDPVFPTVHYCEWIKRWVRMGLEVYGRMALACPEYLDALSRLRGRSKAEGDHFMQRRAPANESEGN